MRSNLQSDILTNQFQKRFLNPVCIQIRKIRSKRTLYIRKGYLWIIRNWKQNWNRLIRAGVSNMTYFKGQSSLEMLARSWVCRYFYQFVLFAKPTNIYRSKHPLRTKQGQLWMTKIWKENWNWSTRAQASKVFRSAIEYGNVCAIVQLVL